MEEKDVKFTIFEEENKNSYNINITSDIDDCQDYLDTNERYCLLIKLLNDSYSQMFINHLGDDPVDFDENNDEHIDVLSEMGAFTEGLIYSILNISNTVTNYMFKDRYEHLEYSLVTYTEEQTISGETALMPNQTIHSDGLRVLDPMQGGFKLIMDSVKCLLDNDVPKEEVKLKINQCVTNTLTILDDYIDKYDEIKE